MNDATHTNSVNAVLTQTHKKRSPFRWVFWLLLLALAGGAGWYYFTQTEQQTKTSFTTETLEKGDIRTTIIATGNLQPVNQVEISSELSGKVSAVFVDINDKVSKGQELARLDTDQLEDTITKAKASLASAKAKVKQAVANIQQSKASVNEAQTNLNRLNKLFRDSGGKLPSKSELDSAKATLTRAKADVNSSNAAKTVADASVTEAEANLRSAQSNQGKAIITSPIDGIVLSRSVEPGQTVAASLSAPTLFLLAEDLAKMELQVEVDEADVGQVQAGQMAEFTVDAWAGRKYEAAITRVSLGATATENVVSYATDLTVENEDLSLRLGMTATATIITQAKDDVLLVPNTALRFTPPAEFLPASKSDNTPAVDGQTLTGTKDQPSAQQGSNLLSKLLPQRPSRRSGGRNKNSTKAVSLANSRQTVWVLENKKPKPIRVKTGISTGKSTEIVTGDLKAGMQVITGMDEVKP